MRGSGWGSFAACAAMAAALVLAGCGKERQSGPAPSGSPSAGVTAAVPKGPEIRILALGDSLFAGYGLRAEQAYPVRLEAALRARGINAVVVNAGVSGDTTRDGRERLDFTLSSQPAPPSLVLICLGGNDMLRGLPPAETRANLDAILTELDRRHIPAMLMGMLAAPNLGPDYAKAFDPIYPALAREHHAGLVPFFLQPVIGRDNLRQADHIHPTEQGVEAIVKATAGQVAAALPGRVPGRGKDRPAG